MELGLIRDPNIDLTSGLGLVGDCHFRDKLVILGSNKVVECKSEQLFVNFMFGQSIFDNWLMIT